MLGSHPMVAFVPSTDLDRSRTFFVETLGLTETERDGFALVVRGGGTTLRITRVDELRPQPFTVLGWVVPDIDKAVADLLAREVLLTRYDGMGQDKVGVWTAPGGARIAWFTDPDGNTLSITELPG
jgi:catechol 2,3-dioxygenase-like lactoylglutathione lyase family enzyme